ncbi:permease [Candidatus Peregrinibacteria bacterium CG_4_9_14_0_2_um_filter_53_11]|nr:MAG: permease [Candidatus Peregrinibacteria bacterium CG_4_9_14_0_2_um_filter_53_11]
MTSFLLYIVLGLFAGVMSGVVGIGGGVVLVPALIFIFGFTQHQAQGTTLALLVPPIGFLAAYTYYRSGFVDLKIALLVGLGFFVGGLIGSKIAVNISGPLLQKIFGSFVILIGVYMIIKK